MKFTRMVIVLSWEFPNQTRRNNAFGSTIFMKKKTFGSIAAHQVKINGPRACFCDCGCSHLNGGGSINMQSNSNQLITGPISVGVKTCQPVCCNANRPDPQ